jgi:uncharacterized protein
MITQFTPWASLFGGALIGVGTVLLMASNGRIAGISGIVSRLFPPYADRAVAERVAFVAGLIAAPVVFTWLFGAPIIQIASNHRGLLVVAGLLVGFGSVYGSGCTSGHGVCGLSRFSVRSLIATCTFMGTAFVTVLITRHVIGG